MGNPARQMGAGCVGADGRGNRVEDDVMTLPPNYDTWRLSPPEAPEPQWDDCPDCDGTGHTLHDEHGPTLDCEMCAGEGVVPAEIEEPDADYLYERRRDAMEDLG